MKRNLKHTNSALARLHANLASKKQWNIDQLADAMQLKAYESQAAKGKENASRVTDDYVKDMLYGRRPMPNRWRIATANALGIGLDDYERQKASVLPSGIELPLGKKVFPIDYWPHFAWRSEFTPSRKIAARLYGLSKSGFSPSFSVVPGKWQAPAGFSEYFKLRNEAWQELVDNYSRMKKEAPNPKSAWHVKNIGTANYSRISLEIMQADYRDILVTASQQGLEQTIQISSGTTCTVRQWLALSWKEGNSSEPVLPGSRHLVVNLMVLTKDGYAVLSRQGPDSPESAGSWTTSISTVVNPKIDCGSDGRPDLARAASRGCKEELNMDTDGTSVRWLTMAAGLKFGSHTFFGLLESQWSKDEIEAAIASNVQHAMKSPTHVCQVVEVGFVELSPKAIAQRLKRHDYRPYLELGVALLLWRNGDAEIIEGVQEAFSKTTKI
jgi:hypothetical protein